MENKKIFLIVSPLIIFLIHVVYLIAWSPNPFFSNWIDGCFSFFIALVLCNIIRMRLSPPGVTTGAGSDRDPSPPGDDGPA